MLKMPFGGDDIAYKRVERLTLGDETLIKETDFPIDQHAADI
jgi:hypothetical protein